MFSGKTLAFVLVLISACVHASWNVAARSLKGNFSILVLAHFYGAFLALPLAIVYGDFFAVIQDPMLYRYIVPSVVIHASYMFLLSTAYYYGDVGLVYPMARGTSIVLATIATQVLSMGDGLTPMEYTGIIVVVGGIFLLAFDVYTSLQNKVHAYESLPTESADLQDAEEGSGSLQSVELVSVLQDGGSPKTKNKVSNDRESSEMSPKSPHKSSRSRARSGSVGKDVLASKGKVDEDKQLAPMKAVGNTDKELNVIKAGKSDELTVDVADLQKKILLSIVFALFVIH